jgi:hypothetical protein
MLAAPQTLAIAILAAHLVVVAFNVGGLVLVPLGSWAGWRFVSGFWWRLAHLGSLAVVALQAILGKSCFLTVWQTALEARADAGEPPPLIATWINGLLYLPLPLWVFATAYVCVFVYTLLLWRWVPPRRPAWLGATS